MIQNAVAAACGLKTQLLWILVENNYNLFQVICQYPETD